MTTSMTLRTRRRSDNKQKTKAYNNGVVHKYIMNILEEFKDLPYIEYRRRQVKNVPTDFFYS